MRVAVAGAGGFLGGAVVRALAATAHVVVPIGREVAADARADVLIWAAGRRERDAAANREVHVDAPVRAARALAVDRVIYLSSGECYGVAPLPYREDGPALGTSAYAQAKLAGERALTAVVGPGALALRIAVGYGPGQASTMLIPSLVAALRAGRPIALTAGLQTRDFVFVDDVAAAVVAALAVDDAAIINIGSGEETRVRDLCLAVADALGAPAALLGFGALELRPGEAMRYVLDVALAARVLGWRPITPLAAGVARL